MSVITFITVSDSVALHSLFLRRSPDLSCSGSPLVACPKPHSLGTAQPSCGHCRFIRIDTGHGRLLRVSAVPFLLDNKTRPSDQCSHPSLPVGTRSWWGAQLPAQRDHPCVPWRNRAPWTQTSRPAEPQVLRTGSTHPAGGLSGVVWTVPPTHGLSCLKLRCQMGHTDTCTLLCPQLP